LQGQHPREGEYCTQKNDRCEIEGAKPGADSSEEFRITEPKPVVASYRTIASRNEPQRQEACEGRKHMSYEISFGGYRGEGQT
jgi:hypothetical protein